MDKQDEREGETSGAGERGPRTPRQRQSTPRKRAREPLPGTRFPSEVVADNVLSHRALRKLNQQGLATRIDALGCPGWHATTVSEVERAMRSVSVDELVALALALDTTVANLLNPTGINEQDTRALDVHTPVPWPIAPATSLLVERTSPAHLVWEANTPVATTMGGEQITHRAIARRLLAILEADTDLDLAARAGTLWIENLNQNGPEGDGVRFAQRVKEIVRAFRDSRTQDLDREADLVFEDLLHEVAMLTGKSEEKAREDHEDWIQHIIARNDAFLRLKAQMADRQSAPETSEL